MTIKIIGAVILGLIIFLIAFAPNAQLNRPSDFYFEVAVGNVLNHSTVNKFGRNTDIDNAAEEDIWDGGGVWSEPSATQVYTVTSTSANDATGGTGARTVQIYGLNSAGALINETISMTGTGVVTLTNSYQMIHRMIVRTAGSGGANAGIIKAVANTDGTVTAQIGTGNNQTLMAIYKIPAGYKGCMIGFDVTINRNVTNNVAANTTLYAKPDGEVWQVKQTHGVVAAGSSFVDHTFQPPNCFDPLTLIKLSLNTSSDNTDVSGSFDLVLRPD